MLINIPPIISPELLAALSEMGHGDTIVLGDGNFPGASIAKAAGAKLIRADGHGVPALLEAILRLIPLDAYVETPVMLMQTAESDKDLDVPIWEEYKAILARHGESESRVGFYERFEFYERAKEAYCVVQSGEAAIYANILLKKGVIK